MEIEVTRLGNRGPAIVLVHGSLSDGSIAFQAQAPLAERWQLLIPNRRGYGGNPPIARVDVDKDAGDVVELLGVGAHLVGTSMGGIVAARAAARAPERTLSLTLIEPPSFLNAVDVPAVGETVDALRRYWEVADKSDPAKFVPGFLETLGIQMALPSPLPPQMLTAARNLMTETPWNASVPATDIAKAPWRKLVVSGASCAAFEAICDRLAYEWGAVRRVFPGAGHAVQRIGEPFNQFLEDFLLATGK
jgi:pimeloyl-ACP methyl ester carboxylesterase